VDQEVQNRVKQRKDSGVLDLEEGDDGVEDAQVEPEGDLEEEGAYERRRRRRRTLTDEDDETVALLLPPTSHLPNSREPLDNVSLVAKLNQAKNVMSTF